MYNYCKTCCHDNGDIGFCDKCYYNHILEEKGILPTEYEAKPKPITNADRIRAMSDEELAEWFDRHASEPLWCVPPECSDYEECVKCILDWLKSPVEVDDGT